MTIFTKNLILEQGADFSIKFNWLVGKIQIQSIVIGSPIIINTSVPHRLTTNDRVIVRETACYPDINENYQVTVIDTTSFSITGGITEVSVTPDENRGEKESSWTDPYYGFIGIPKNLTGYSWSAKVSNNYSNSAGVSGILGSVVAGSNQVLLNITTNTIKIEVGDFVTITGSGITNSPVKSIISSPNGLNAVIETMSSATTTVTNAKIIKTAGTIAQFLVESVENYGEIILSLAASATANFPIEGDRKYFWDLFGTTLEGSKMKLIKGILEINPSVL